MLAARRATIAALEPPAPTPEIRVLQADWSGVRCVVCTPPEPRDVLLYLHGGGYRLGRAAEFTPFAARLAAATRAEVVVVDYRLAPEYPYPAALHDTASVYTRLVAASKRPPILVGDSAGGGLAAALTIATGRAGTAPPRGLVLISAWLDLHCTAPSYRSRAAHDRMFSLASAREAADQYLQGHHPDDPLASPVLGDVTGFPPTLLFASSDEVLLDDTIRMASALAQARVPVATRIMPGLPHTWPNVLPDHPDTTAALRTIAHFVDGSSPPDARPHATPTPPLSP
ncbi:alpha/beta hydrolase [Frankia sp. Ag45/Mut15]|uniref:Alpha/beta hydrolase n=1 Tax=Frankia umida TaxID=573489 RepID=A0ABT0K100_9ACTN|nr:alpha/beta hydrolase [Frankia umida]MCK9877137.1 alpha/beta hydrolase [Frankia umida]